jgi:outer membrane immunogenic protein
MRWIVRAALALACSSGAASAADLGPYHRGSIKDDVVHTRPLSWTGFYIGAQVGAAWGSSIQTDASGTTTGDYDMDGWFGGGTIGYNFQSGVMVWGAEADIAAADISGGSFTNCPGGCTSNVDWFGTVRARLGVDFNGVMPFITGGFAFGGAEANTQGLVSASDTVTGWTMGGGVEVRLDPRWSVKAEYLFLDLGDVDVPTPVPVTAEFDDIHLVRAGLNYRF